MNNAPNMVPLTELFLKRTTFTEQSTIGELSIEKNHECFILEDYDRKLTKENSIDFINRVKIFSLTCIPYGRYEIVISFSNRFKCLMPLLVGVPGWEGVRIHWGNWAKDTEGCLIVGKTKGNNYVGSSREEYSSLLGKLQELCSKGKVFINIIN